MVEQNGKEKLEELGQGIHSVKMAKELTSFGEILDFAINFQTS
jgi:hypothetical protein